MIHEVILLYEDFCPSRLNMLRTQAGISARDMSLSLGQNPGYINNIENRKAFRDPLYAKGKFIKYERVGDTLYFDRPHE